MKFQEVMAIEQALREEDEEGDASDRYVVVFTKVVRSPGEPRRGDILNGVELKKRLDRGEKFGYAMLNPGVDPAALVKAFFGYSF